MDQSVVGYRQLIRFSKRKRALDRRQDDTLAKSNERGDKGFITTAVVHLKH